MPAQVLPPLLRSLASLQSNSEDKGSAPLHVLGGRPGGLLFQNLEKLG
jgi:hypothetical protein